MVLRLLTKSFPAAEIIALGKKAEQLLSTMGITPAACISHPANGGACAFSEGLEKYLRIRA